MTTHFVKGALLIHEPNEGLRESLKLILEDEFDLLFVDGIKEAQNHASSEKVELLILNVDDHSKGLEFIREINKTHPRLKLFLLSTNFDEPFLRAILNITNRFNILEKPFGPKEFKRGLDIFRKGTTSISFPSA